MECAMRSMFAATLMLGGALVSCGSKNDGATATIDESTLTFTTGPFQVPPGDQFECFYTSTKTPRELGVQGSHGQQQSGGHHITVYYTDVERPPQHHPCDDKEMVNWHMVGGTAGDDGAAAIVDKNLALPEGMALKIPAGKQLVMQVHYINTSKETKTVNDSVTLRLLQPSQVKSYANYIAASHESWEIPPKAPFETTATCTVTQDLQVLLLLGHMHEYGKHYKLERLGADGVPVETLYEQEWEPSFTAHPPINRYTPEKPLLIKAGTKMKQTCKWDNTTDQSMLFPREMCVFFAFYFPDKGELFCERDK
jgi:hypothetical protein